MSVFSMASLRDSEPIVASDSVQEDASSAKRANLTVQLVGISTVVALVLALSAWLALYLSDSIFQARLLPWDVPLIELQDIGFLLASRMFPCQAEGFDTGCEWYKTLPTFVTANAPPYLPVVFVGAYWYRRSERLKALVQSGLHSFIRWGAGFAIVTLCLRQFVAKWWPGVPLGNGNTGQMLWVAVDNLRGIVGLVLFLAMPFYIYQGLRVRNVTEKKRYMADFTWMAVLYVCSLMLASVYSW
jgi:hypothetical protein